MIHVEVRVAGPEDTDGLFMLNELFNGKDSSTKARMRECLASNGGELAAVAIVDGIHAGFCCAQRIRSLCYRDDFAQIEELYVRPEYRRMGVGRALMEFVESRLVSMGAAEFHVCTGGDNHNAQKFYESLGYRPGGVMYKKDA